MIYTVATGAVLVWTQRCRSCKQTFVLGSSDVLYQVMALNCDTIWVTVVNINLYTTNTSVPGIKLQGGLQLYSMSDSETRSVPISQPNIMLVIMYMYTSCEVNISILYNSLVGTTLVTVSGSP